jgi:predicted ATPase
MSLPDRKRPPALERLTGYEAIRLFAERASALKPGFEINDDNAPAVVEICHRLDGLPLAIELAAARIKVLSPQAMLVRLQDDGRERRLHLVASKDRDVPTRQQTLRNTIDWSYNLLDDSERVVFRRMATFQGGRTLHAIQSICSGTGDRGSGAGATSPVAYARFPARLDLDLLDEVESLVNKSLLQPDLARGQESEDHDREPRFWMLETIHEYAREKLRESGEEAEIRRRHARYFLDLVEQASPHLKQEDQAKRLEQLEDEHDNIRAAFRWSREFGEAGDIEAAEVGLRLAIALERFWEVRVYLREGLEQTVGVLAIGKPGGALRARALKVAAALADVCGDYDIALSMLEESMRLWQDLGDKKSLVETLHALGTVLYSQRDIEKARFYFEESLRIEQEVSDRKTSLHSLGIMFYEQGDYSSAGSLIAEALEIERKIGDTRRVALALANLGLVAYQQGDYALALSRQRESLAIRQALGAKLGIAWSLEGLAILYLALDRAEKAARLWGASQAMREAIGAPLPPKEHARYQRELEIVRAQLGDEGFQRAYDEGRSMTSEQAVAYATEDA